MSGNGGEGPLPQSIRTDVGDHELAALLYEGEGPPLVFLHATGFPPWLWHPLARSLAGDCRVHAPCLCPHRAADPETGGVSWQTLARDLALFCRKLALDSPYLVGHSMGATLAVIANALYGLASAGMVLIEPILLPPELYGLRIGVEQHPLASRALKRTNFWRDRDEARVYLRSRPLFRDWDAEMLELYLRHGIQAEGDGFRLACRPQDEAALFVGGGLYDPWPLLPEITAPVLILEGGESDNRGFVDIDRIRRLIPDCRHKLVEGAGHLIPMEKPGEVARLVGDFLAANPPARTRDSQGRQQR